MTSNVIQALWIGARLGLIEQLSLASFLHHGHEVHLYLYAPCEGIPRGTTVRDGRDILPEEEIFFYGSGYGKGSPSAFSTSFAMPSCLTVVAGGWTSCRCPSVRVRARHVLWRRRRASLPAGGYAPPGSALMKWYSEVPATDQQRVVGRSGEVARTDHGPGNAGRDAPPSVFYPVDARDFWHFIRAIRRATPRRSTSGPALAPLWPGARGALSRALAVRAAVVPVPARGQCCTAAASQRAGGGTSFDPEAGDNRGLVSVE
jgi:hypothetical protein